MAEDTLFEFPCEFPIKAAGIAGEQTEIEIIAIVRKYVPDLNETSIKVRNSKTNKYVSLTIMITATSKTQLDNIYQDLTANERVVWAL